jgi:hypothetical protein
MAPLEQYRVSEPMYVDENHDSGAVAEPAAGCQRGG